MARLNLTVESSEELYKQSNATGVVFIKSGKDELTSFEFYRGRNGRLYTTTGTSKAYRAAATLKELANAIPEEE